jgi:putative ABC transport system ATP-binding protein
LQEEIFIMDILTVNGLTKHYGEGDNLVRAVDGVSFSVRKGEFLCIIGASGSGKSTLLHLLGGVDRPTSGTVTIDGTDIYTLDESRLAIFRRRHIGLIYQFYNLLPTLSTKENIMLPWLLDGRKPDGAKLGEILEATGMADRQSHLPGQLSGGQQQRVSIGRALINDPAIILADEPTGNLDSKSGADVMELLKYANKHYGQTLIMITHDERIALMADRVITIEDGKIKRDEVQR